VPAEDHTLSLPADAEETADLVRFLEDALV